MSHKGEPGKESHQGVARRGRAAPAELPLGIDQAPPAATDTQAVVAAFAAEVQRRGGTATPQWRARVGRDAKRLLADGVPVADLVEAAVRAGARGRADLDAMLASPTGQSPRPSDRERLYAAWDGIAAVAGA